MNWKPFRKSIAVIASLLMSITANSQESGALQKAETPADTIVMSERLRARLDSLTADFDLEERETFIEDLSDNPLLFKLFMPVVLYGSSIWGAVSPDAVEESTADDDLLPLAPLEDERDMVLAKMIDEALMKIYLEHPELVKMTEEELMGVPGIIPISDNLANGINLEEQAATGKKPTKDDVLGQVEAKYRYWKTFGNFQGKYTQSHYSDNWYKGGESNHSLLGQINLEANFAKNHTTFDNKLEMKLGYYTTEVDGETKFRTNEDLLRFTSKFGLKAWESWYYSAQFQGYTQFMDVYDTKVPTKLKSKFFAPAYGNVSLGMDYKPKFKNKNITLSLMLSPLSYNCRYVSVDSIATNFGIDAGKKYKYTIGSRLEGNVKWKFLTDFTWTGKAQFYTSYESTEVNLENTLDYKLNKYFSLQFFCHWRFDDSVKRKKDKQGNLMGYGQFKEFLTLNFNYAW